MLPQGSQLSWVCTFFGHRLWSQVSSLMCRGEHRAKHPPEPHFIFLALTHQLQRHVSKVMSEILTPHFLPVDCSEKQQPTGSSHKNIFRLMPFILLKGNMVLTVIAVKLAENYDPRPYLNVMGSETPYFRSLAKFPSAVSLPTHWWWCLLSPGTDSLLLSTSCRIHSSFSLPFSGILVSTVLISRIVLGS